MRRHELARVREQETGAGGGGVRGVQRGAGHLCRGQHAGVSTLHRQVTPPVGAGDREDRGRHGQRLGPASSTDPGGEEQTDIVKKARVERWVIWGLENGDVGRETS